MLDIHSHILPGVDDGAADVAAAVSLLEIMKQQGITDVIATPHFYAMDNNIDEFEHNVAKAYSDLYAATVGKDLPNVSIGCEVFYFTGIGRSTGIRELTLCRSNHILLELPNCRFDKEILRDITDITDRLGLTVILAHLERYASEKGFKDLLKLVDNESVLVQINASSLFNPYLKKATLKLINSGYASFLATDTHSENQRPPMMSEALEEIKKQFGARVAQMFVDNSRMLYDEIFRLPIA